MENKKVIGSYKMVGPQDSQRDGYWQDGMTGRIELETPIGTLIAEVAGPQDYPGFYLSFRKEGSDFEQTVALMEVPHGETDLKLHIWEDGDEDGNDPTLDMVIPVDKDGGTAS